MRLFRVIIWLGLVGAIWGVVLYVKSPSRRVHAVPETQSSLRNGSAPTGNYTAPVTLGTLKNRSITESSGLAASKANPGIYWTHNDSGGGPLIYAIDASGASRGVWQVPLATCRDWEDMAVGPGPQAGKSYLYIGDIGDNDAARPDIVVYRIPEPTVAVANASATKAKPLTTEPPEVLRFRYPDGKHDAEALLVHPQTGNVYLVTKVLFESPGLYEGVAPFRAGLTNTLKRLGSLAIPSLLGGVITGGSISPDGTRVALCDYLQAYELVLPKNESSFETIWKQSFVTIDLGKRTQGEAITYRLDSKALLATSEGRHSPIIQVVSK
ncbi:MAG TPA: hypothetical protein VLA93_23000 [Pyrinomonadaceae bacterium]|nr:hypothetical protein [Pyrinomonadaceae bacterium]